SRVYDPGLRLMCHPERAPPGGISESRTFPLRDPSEQSSFGMTVPLRSRSRAAPTSLAQLVRHALEVFADLLPIPRRDARPRLAGGLEPGAAAVAARVAGVARPPGAAAGGG